MIRITQSLIKISLNWLQTGKPSDEFLNQPITSADHPFIRQYAHLDHPRGENPALPKPGESELDFYERRYKERVG
jgi:hypothetical protein